jgi:hypothetical protein
VVKGYLDSPCAGLNFVPVSQLPGPDWVYSGPWVSTATPCKCSMVYYSITSACGHCQYSDFLTWSQWSTNCTAIYTTQFPDPIPASTRVPHWAYLPIGSDDRWNLTAARKALSGPESTATYGHTSSATTAPVGTATVTSGGTTGGANPNIGAIVGGAVGGAIGLALVALLGIWLFRRRDSGRVGRPFSINTEQYPGSPVSEGRPPLRYLHTGSTMTTNGPSMRALSSYDPTLLPVHDGSHDGHAGAGYKGRPEVYGNL